ncbi:MAG: twin-arginine translocase TatA/TatE family subunit [Desulfobaccales bacterium]
MGIDLPEILILLVLALILFGPEKLPEYGAKLGRFVARMRQAGAEVTQPLQQALHSGQFPVPPPSPSPYNLLKENFCHQCGHTLEADFQFCPRCGRRLEKSEGSSAELAS